MTTDAAERMPPGSIRDAIVSFLSLRDGPASLDDIYDGVRSGLGDIPESSVRSYLNINEGTTFVRTGRGQYALRFFEPEPTPPAPAVAFAYGRSTLLHGNCFDWLANRADCSIHAVVTDPPYGMLEYQPDQLAKLRAGSGGVWRIPPAFDGHERSPLPRFTVLSDADRAGLGHFFEKFGKDVLPKLVPGAHVIVASNPLLSHVVSSALSRSGLERRGEVVRLVMTMRGGDRPKNAHDEFSDVTVMPRSMWEPWLLFRKPLERTVAENLRKWGTGGLRRLSPDRPFGDVIPSHPARPKERAIAPHPSLKPQSFMRQIVRAVLPLGTGTVFDPFAGSGSTLAAAECHGYESIGVEIDRQYVELAKAAIPALAQLAV